ncbi:MAG: tetratricopeptide repeat protein [Thermodesulfobacteriota bacterium]|nr:tetratricopeptide repeat protein [Thermodesulfobacteriota bacterium]
MSVSYLYKSLNIYDRFFFYRPLSVFTLALNYHWGKEDTFGYHIVNLSFHMITAFILFLFLYKTFRLNSCNEFLKTKAYHISLFGSILWAIHPIQTQAVTYLVQRMAILAALFTIMSVYFYANFRTTKRRIFLLGMTLSSLFAFASKENTVVLPFLILIYEWLFFQRGKLSFFLVKHLIIGVFVILLGLTAITMILGGPGITTSLFEVFNNNNLPGRDFSAIERLLTEQRVILYYLSLIFFPSLERFNLDHDFKVSHGWLDPPTTLLSAFIIVSLIVLAWRKRREFPFISWVICWYFLTLLVESSVFNLELIFEHRAYLSSMLVFPLIVIGIFSVEKLSIQKKIPYISGVILVFLIIIFGYATFQRNYIWKDPLSLWSDCLRKSPKKARCYINLGTVLSRADRKEEALHVLRKSVDLAPEKFHAHYAYGDELMGSGAYDNALFHLRKASRIKPTSSLPFCKIGLIYLRLNDFSSAKRNLLKALELNNKSYEARNNLALIYYYEGRYSTVISLLKEILEENPRLDKVQFNLGLLYKKIDSIEESVYWMEKAVQRNSSFLRKIHLIEAYKRAHNKKKAAEVYASLMRDIGEKRVSKCDLWTHYIEPLEKDKKTSIYSVPISEIDYKQWKQILNGSCPNGNSLLRIDNQRG